MNQERVFQILLGPHRSETAAMAAEHGTQDVCRVARAATTNESQPSVAQLVKVRVDDVRTLRVKGKSKRNRFGVHTSSTWKKAYVRLEQGQEIDLAAIS